MMSLSKVVILLVTTIALSGIACSDKGSGSDGLEGTWNLTEMSVMGETIDPESKNEVPVKWLFRGDGTGQFWIEDYGFPRGSSPYDLTWQVSGDELVLLLGQADDERAAYSLVSDNLTLTLWSIEFSYIRQE